ncbi:MAG: endolytic transglycosylase MltG [Gammaproteobacteria bacterium]|nr:endolytic transglycosylase MltG [Gammaproteobacteria bacterium]
MRFIGYLLLFGLLAVLLVAAAGFYQAREFLQTPLNLPAEGRVVNIPPGASLRSIGRDLEAQGLLSSELMLYAFARLNQRANRIQAGEFLLPQGTRPEGLLDILEKGSPVQYQLALIEGWNFQQVLAAVRADPVLEQTLQGLDAAQIMQRLGRPGEHPEGRFFPDTYSFSRGASDLEFLRRSYQRMSQELERLWPQRSADVPLKEPYEALILASIIEKETGAAEERPEIAGVFSRRLNKGMRLQTDPTVIYGMGAAYDGNIRRQDLKTDTPYNTYTRSGLPPTPICMPGQAALEAALNPKPGDSLYFVARGDGSGTHVFSSNLKDHNKAVREHQLKK